jgi:hypothetical protein
MFWVSEMNRVEQPGVGTTGVVFANIIVAAQTCDETMLNSVVPDKVKDQIRLRMSEVISKCLVFWVMVLNNVGAEDASMTSLWPSLVSFLEIIQGTRCFDHKDFVPKSYFVVMRVLVPFMQHFPSCAAEGDRIADDMPFSALAVKFRKFKALVVLESDWALIHECNVSDATTIKLKLLVVAATSSQYVKVLITELRSRVTDLYTAWHAAFIKAVTEPKNSDAPELQEYTDLRDASTSLGDHRLSKQLEFLDALGRSEAAQITFETAWSAADTEEARSIMNIGTVFTKLSSTAKPLRVMIQNGVLKGLYEDDGTWGHFDIVEAVDNAADIVEQVVTRSDGLLTQARDAWAAHAEQAVKCLVDWCPAWEVEKDRPEFPTKEMVKLLLLNKHYPDLTPLGNKLDDILKASSTMVRGGCPPIFSPELLKRSANARDIAYSTTSLTYCVHKLIVQLPKQLCIATRARQAKELKAALAEKNFHPPAGLEKRLEAMICASA